MSDSNNGHEEEDFGAAGIRQRNDSESSKSSDDSADNNKRQKRTAQEFMFPGVAASPPKFVSLEEIIAASNGMNNMALAHEIAVDNEFRLKKAEPEHPLHKVVHETVHRAFWDVLDKQLKEDPPVYLHALSLLEEIKQSLFSLLLPQHLKIRADISETLDIDLIKQQAEKGVLDFQRYAQFVIGLMGKLCAPARDDRIRELTQMSETVPIFRGIMQTLELMRLDWANFHIGLIRPTLVSKSVEYERKKFEEYLKVAPDGLENTQQWLLRHYTPDAEASSSIQTLTSQVVAKAYLELLDWDKNNPYPETVAMDETRFNDLGDRHRRLCVIGATMLVTSTNVPALQGVASFREAVKDHLNTVLQEAKTEPSVKALMPNVAAQVLKDVNVFLEKHSTGALDETASKLLEGQIVDIGRLDNNIRQLVRLRVEEFLHQTITSSTAAPLRVPPGLSLLNVELTSLTGSFLRLVSHNRSVFGEFYTKIMTAAVERPLPSGISFQ